MLSSVGTMAFWESALVVNAFGASASPIQSYVAPMLSEFLLSPELSSLLPQNKFLSQRSYCWSQIGIFSQLGFLAIDPTLSACPIAMSITGTQLHVQGNFLLETIPWFLLLWWTRNNFESRSRSQTQIKQSTNLATITQSINLRLIFHADF